MKICKTCEVIIEKDKEYKRCPGCLQSPPEFEDITKDDIRYVRAIHASKQPNRGKIKNEAIW